MICEVRFFSKLKYSLLSALMLMAYSIGAQVNGDLQIPDYRGLRMVEGMLHFRTQAEFETVYNDLNTRYVEWNNTETTTTNNPVPGAPCPDPDPLLQAFEDKFNLRSIRKQFVDLECEQLAVGKEPEAIPDHYLVDDVLAAMLNEKYQIRIGNDIYYCPDQFTQYQIKNADYEALAALENGVNPFSLEHVVILENNEICDASFTINSDGNSTTVGFAFTGTPQSDDATLLWEFGDGQSSFEENPTHQYASNGSYTVCLTVESSTTDICWDKKCQDIQVGNGICLPFFIWNETGNNGELCFVDDSPIIGNVETWTWDFGDGSPTVSGSNPCHTFSCDKLYFVSLSITTSSGCAGSITEPVWVNSNACCAKYANTQDYKYFGSGNTRRIKYEQGHIQLPFFRRVAAKIKNYELNNNGNWRLERADLRINLEGQVFTQASAGCKCQVPYNIDGVRYGFNSKRLTMTRSVGQLFKAKKTAEWLAKYWVDGVMIWEQETPVLCD